jgi:lipoprotein-releasing system permease protein
MGVFHLALRYLRSRRIAVISILTIAVGVMAMIVVTALMDGVEGFLVDHLKGTRADLAVSASPRLIGANHWNTVRRRLEPEMEGGPVAALAPRHETRALAVPGADPGPEAEDYVAGVLLVGIDFDLERQVIDLDRFIADVGDDALRVPAEQREHALERSPNEEYPRILLGDTLARQLRVSRTGTARGTTNLLTVVAGTLVVDENDELGFDQSRSEVFRVAGCFTTGRDDFDGLVAYVDRRVLMELRFENPAEHADATAVQVRLRDGEDVSAARRALAERHPDLRFVSWEESSPGEIRAIREQKRIVLVILFFIVAVSSMAILGIVHMMVVEKTRDIGILRSMGLGQGRVIAVFTVYGGLLALLGALLGTLLGLQVVANVNGIADWLSRTLRVELFSAEIYRFKRIPTHVDPTQILIIILAALALSLLAALIPAIKAGRMSPVRALRSD